MPKEKPGQTGIGGSDKPSGGEGGTSGGGSGFTFTPPPGGSGSGSGGSGGGSGLSAAQAAANNKAFFINTLKELGIPLTGNLSSLVSNAVGKHYNTANFLFYLRQTAEYHKRFRGIFDDNGTLKMSEAQYLSAEKQFESIATKVGINVSPKLMDWLFLNDVTPSKFSARALAVSRLKRNRDLFESFKAELIQSGAAKPGEITKKGLLKLIMGEGNSLWVDVWQDAVTRSAATAAGLAVGKKKSLDFLSQGLIERISGMGLSEAALQKGFEQLADDITGLLPRAELYGQTLTQKDLVTLRFGGKGRQEIAEKVQGILAQQNLEQEPKAQAQLYQTEKGTKLNYGGLAGEAGE